MVDQNNAMYEYVRRALIHVRAVENMLEDARFHAAFTEDDARLRSALHTVHTVEAFLVQFMFPQEYLEEESDGADSGEEGRDGGRGNPPAQPPTTETHVATDEG